MSLSINTNQTSLFAQNQLGEIRQSQAGALRSLASGQRINSAAENPAVAAIVQQFAAQIAGSDQAARNLNDGVSLTQVADGAIGQLQANSGRLRELAVAAGNSTLSAADRGALQAEADQLVQANNDIVKQTNFNGNPLLQGGSPLGFQSGANAGQQTSLAAANLAAAPASGGLFSLAGGIDLSSAAKASQTLGNLDTDLDTLASSRASFGAASNAFTAEIGNLQTRSDNLAAARSRSNDTDYAAASAQLAQQQILGQANIAVQSQANASASQVLGLLR